ncbi:AbrB family transcriptional regulator [Salinisphaera sp. Q1T1-3]|nr:AbrB family transcriptional regulator [Salinisphaera sp. Q1T1-3]
MRWAMLVVSSVLLGGLLETAGLPAGFLLGGMAAAIGMAVSGRGVTIAPVVFQLAQAVIGVMIARTITWPILAEIGRDWPVFAAGVFSVIAISLSIGWVLTRWQLLPGPTAIWGMAPGAAVAMTVMAGDYGADERLVAFMQYLRVVVVATLASVVGASVGQAPVASHGIAWLGGGTPTLFAATLGLIAVAFGLGRVWRVPAGGLILAMILGALAQNGAGLAITLPEPLLAVNFIVVGWAIGSRFTRDTLGHVVRALPSVLVSLVVLVAACGGLAMAMVELAGIDPLTAYLATSPGGADSIAIIANGTHVDVAYVVAMQLARFLVVMCIGPPLARLMTRRAGYGGAVDTTAP